MYPIGDSSSAMKLTEDDIVSQLMDITQSANGLSSLEANLHNSRLLKQTLENQEYREYYNETYITDLQEKAEKWDTAIKDGLIFGDKEWVLDSVYELKQENKQLKEIVERLRKYHDDGFDIQNGSSRDIWASIWEILHQTKIPQWALDEWPDLKVLGDGKEE